MSQLARGLVIHTVALGCAAAMVQGVHFVGEGPGLVVSMLVVAIVFGLVNALIKPLMAFATCGLYVLTLGLFHFVVNALMLQLTAWLASGMLVVEDFWSAFLGALVISIVSTVLTMLFNPEQDDDDRDGRVIVVRS
jgi:putative membrane protein